MNNLFSQVQNDLVSAEQFLAFAEKLGKAKPREKSKKELDIQRRKEQSLITITKVYAYQQKLSKKYNTVFMSQVRISHNLELSLTTVKRALKYLAKRGLLFIGHIYRQGYYYKKRICCYFLPGFITKVRAITLCKHYSSSIRFHQWGTDVMPHMNLIYSTTMQR
jgi:hypothetical protein